MPLVYAGRESTATAYHCSMAIHLSEYSESWIQDFMTVATKLVDALDGHGGQGIEHIGSTAVPGLVSRPIIDIAVIAAPLALDEASAALEKLGYMKAHANDEAGESDPGSDSILTSPGYVRFNTPNDAVLHSLTVFTEESPLLHAHLATRHVLMNNDALRDEFAGYKRGLAYTGAISIDEYRGAKTPMFAKVLAEAGMSEDDAAQITAHYRSSAR